jgi:hypothetical protein
VYQTALEYEADMIKANLDGAGIDALVFNQHDSVYFVNMGSLALVNIMVQKHEVDKALEIISALEEDEGLAEDVDPGRESA